MAALHIIDGGLSTELERLGAQIAGELWTGKALLDDPALVEQAHRNYAAAGAEVVITSSYQLSRQGFVEVGLTVEEADTALRNSVAVARRAVRGTEAKVAASIGPYGAVLHDGSEYRGDYTVDQAYLEAFHAERLAVLLEAEPDFLAVETIPNLAEAKALANVLAETDVPSWVSFTAGSGASLWSGEAIEDAVRAVSGIPKLFAVGVNCVDPAHVAELASRIRSVSNLEIVAYPNRGGVWNSEQGIWIGQEPKALSEWFPEWSAAGVSWFGGCCGTHSGDIRTLYSAVAKFGSGILKEG